MTIAVRDFLMRMDGMDANIDGAPNAKQWTKIREWIEALKEASAGAVVAGDPVAVPQTGPSPAGPKPPVPAETAAVLKQIEAIKRAGQAQAGGGQALSAGV